MNKSSPFSRRRTKWMLLVAAISALPLFDPRPAQAQFLTNNDGRARDASNRVGSNGINEGGGGFNNSVSGNQIVTGNVTRGQAFRGSVPYGEGNSFRGRTAGETSDRFIRDSSGAAVRGSPNLNSTFTAQAFYGQARAVAPPTGTINLGTTGGYVTPTPGQLDYSIKPQQFGNPWAFSGSGANAGWNTSPANLGTTTLINPSTFGQSARNGRRIYLSPLSGVRTIPAGDGNPDFTVGPDGTVNRTTPNGMTVEQMRSELLGTGGNAATGSGSSLPTGQIPSPTLKGTPASPNQIKTGPTAPPENPQNPTLSPGAIDNGATADPSLSAGLNTGQGIRRELPTPAQQSVQYNELRQRLEKARGQELSDQEAMQLYKTYQKAAGGAAPGKPAGSVPGTPGTPAAPGGVVPQTPLPGGGAAAIPAGPPVEVKSFATGIQAQGLGGVMKSAEDLVKQGKFAAALDQYDTAEQVAPNNPMIWLGKANAELGASSYRSAEAHIRQAFGTDRALLMGKYDLRSMIGDDRLRVLITDLADLAKANADDATPPFLLSYIFYNTGNAPLAAQWLNDAERRQGKPDPVIQSMRNLWQLKPAAGTDNK